MRKTVNKNRFMCGIMYTIPTLKSPLFSFLILYTSQTDLSTGCPSKSIPISHNLPRMPTASDFTPLGGVEHVVPH